MYMMTHTGRKEEDRSSMRTQDLWDKTLSRVLKERDWEGGEIKVKETRGGSSGSFHAIPSPERGGARGQCGLSRPIVC